MGYTSCKEDLRAYALDIVRSALYEPDAPPVKVIFFSKDEHFAIGRIFFWAEFALKSRGFGEVIYVKSFVSITYKA
jgi:hypothetical protein